MPKPNRHSLQRSLNAMTIGVVRGQQRRERELAPMRLDERDQHVQVPLVGVVSQDLSEWVEIELDFAYAFMGDENVRDSPYDKPTFSFGVEMLTEEPVIIAAVISEWIETDEGEATGCVVKAASFTPNPVDEGKEFRAKLHMTFSGYCGPIDGPDEGEES